MNCPACSHVGAYVGFTEVECLNPNCRYYDTTKNSRVGVVFISTPRGLTFGYSDKEIPIDAPVRRRWGEMVEVVIGDDPHIAGFCVHFEWFGSIPEAVDGFERFLRERQR